MVLRQRLCLLTPSGPYRWNRWIHNRSGMGRVVTQ